MKQSLLKIQLPAGATQLHASAFREMLAKGGDGSPLLPAEFFNYTEAGRPKSDVAPEIRVIGGRGWVGILSTRENSDLFDRAVGLATRIAFKHFNQPLPIRIDHPEFSFAESETPVTYYLRDMAMKRRSPKSRDLSPEAVAKERILGWMDTYGKQHGFDVPTDARLGIVFHEFRAIGMRLRTKTGNTNEFVTLVNAELSMNARLDGIWQVGNLQSRGYGRLIRKGDWNGVES